MANLCANVVGRFGILFTDTVIGYISLIGLESIAEDSMEADLMTNFGSLCLGTPGGGKLVRVLPGMSWTVKRGNI